MSQMKIPGVKPQIAQRADGRWVASALAFYWWEGAPREQEITWLDAGVFATREEAETFAQEQGTAWLRQKLGDQS